MGQLSVGEAMSRDVPALDAGLSLDAALEQMKRAGLRTMPVTESDGSLRGTLAWRDAEAALHEGGSSRTVAHASRNGVAIAAREPLETAEALLHREQVGLLPVVEGSRPIGVITRSLIRSARERNAMRTALQDLRPPDELVQRYNASADELFDTAYAGVAALRHYGLQPHHAVLDPGCGIGRLGLALTQYLEETGRYEGFDLFRDCIEWCAANITPRHPNFRFTHADIAVTVGNPGGRIPAEEYTFPYGDSEFDFVVLVSVFTHMLAEGFERYLSEIARVLKPDGRVWATFLLLNERSREQMASGRGAHQPVHDRGSYSITLPHHPEDTVAFREDYVREVYGRLGFEILQVTRGDWATKDHPVMGFQDGIVASLRPEA
jgi:CBS domain-containing protein